MSCISILSSHAELTRRRNDSEVKLAAVRKRVNRPPLSDERITLFCAGSLARGEFGLKSDLDAFVLSDGDEETQSRLYSHTLFGELIAANRDLRFEPFSNEGRFLQIQAIDKLISNTGSPVDDVENLFTTRILLLLESRPITNDALYANFRRRVIANYFRDSIGRQGFVLLFLLNDLLRYWRTLCLNYEERRADQSGKWKWRKKNVNLRFARRLTVFASVLAIVTEEASTEKRFTELCDLTPLERLAIALDRLRDRELDKGFARLLGHYEQFLQLKEKDDAAIKLILENPKEKEKLRAASDDFSNVLFGALMHEKIKPEYRRFLVT